MHSDHCCQPMYPAPQSCGPEVSWYPIPVPYYYPVACCTCCGAPLDSCTCEDDDVTMQTPQEIDVDPTNTTKEFVVGGRTDANLVLEYLPVDGAPAPELTLDCVDPSGTTTIHETAIAAGFHVKDDFLEAAPGTKLKLTVKDCFARLRWCESITY
ncbi:MAG: hypothetical protein PHC61_02615 [Chitinivibrionales bacterium]|nr:hypothetical protein [Chitinivibrionales bacterium]